MLTALKYKDKDHGLIGTTNTNHDTRCVSFTNHVQMLFSGQQTQRQSTYAGPDEVTKFDNMTDLLTDSNDILTSYLRLLTQRLF